MRRISVNDRLMKSAGFRLDLKLEKVSRPDCNYNYWVNDNELRIMVSKTEKLPLDKLIEYVTDQAAYKTRRRLKEKMACIDAGEHGFVK